MPALTKSDRDALAPDHFAVPDKRLLPIHDEAHVRMAWGGIDEVGKIGADERGPARRRILAAAETLGIDTAGWSKLNRGIAIEAMSVVLPEVGGHPNKHPFSGVLVRLDEPSDMAPHGSNGRKIQITRAAAEAALDSLACMAIDFTPNLDGHDAQKKIGVITSASIVDEAAGPAVAIEGFFYASDFPDETTRIRASSDKLGFSFEARNILVADPGADVLEITELAFTGAAVLFKDKAAYHRTSLAAAAAEDIDMTKEELAVLLAEAVGPLKSQLDAVSASNDALKAQNDTLVASIHASRAVMDKVEPHAAALEAAASAMEADGVGSAERRGHVAALKLMASSMRAEAAMGKVPSTFDSYGSYYAAADDAVGKKPDAAAPVTIDAAAIEAAVAAAVAPLNAKIEAAAAELVAAKAENDTKVADIKAAAVRGAEEPVRKTLHPSVTALMARAAITAPEGDAKLDVKLVDEALSKAGLTTAARMQAKAGMAHAGIL